jgi:hypothetical protein
MVASLGVPVSRLPCPNFVFVSGDKLNKRQKIGLIVVTILLIVAFAGLVLMSRSQIIAVLIQPEEERPPAIL